MRDAIYSVAWLDLHAEPVVVHAPDSGDRYVSTQLADFYSDLFGYVGPSVNNGRSQTALVVGPHWQGAMPEGIDVVMRSPTPNAFLVARVSSPGGADLPAARALQQQSWVKPLSIWESGGATPEVRDVLVPSGANETLADFRTMNAAMHENPPPASDEALMRQFAQVGLGPMAETALNALDEATKRGLARALVDGPKLLEKVALTGGNTKQVGGWFYGDKNWGRMAAAGDFLGRASPQAYSGIIEHWIEQSTKLRTFIDADGQDLTGQCRYTMHFRKDEIPQAKAFWSITVYGNDGFMKSANNIVNSSNVKLNVDGAFTVYYGSNEACGDVANRLDVPEGWNFLMRVYRPGASVLDGSYKLPKAVAVE
jgi:hypothetical protein